MLVVEDDPSAAKLTAIAIRAAGGNVQHVPSATAAALLLLAGLRPSVVVLDLRLAGTSGLDLARFLKASPELAPIPLVAVSASGPRFGASAARDAGCDGYLAKPIDVGTFAASLAAYARGAS